jgi:PTH1 family peptidyl-tRNA hydrolase
LCGKLSDCSRQGIFADADFSDGTLFSTKKVLAIKPRTLMNRSGKAVEKYLACLRLPASRMLVVVDDYNLPLGKIRARGNGSDGGHNGLKSIIGCIGEEFPRLRIGIGPCPGKGSGIIDFVLGTFSANEEEQLKSVIPRAAEACELFVKSGIQTVMNRFN